MTFKPGSGKIVGSLIDELMRKDRCPLGAKEEDECVTPQQQGCSGNKDETNIKKFATIAVMEVALAGPWAGCATTPKAETAPAVKRDIAADAIIHIRGVT